MDQITQVFLTAMQDDQSWPYRFPHRTQYPEDHWNHNRDLFRSFISPEYDDWSVVVVEVLDDAQAWRIVAFSVWDISYVNKRVHGPGYIPNSHECASTTTCKCEELTPVQHRTTPAKLATAEGTPTPSTWRPSRQPSKRATKSTLASSFRTRSSCKFWAHCPSTAARASRRSCADGGW